MRCLKGEGEKPNSLIDVALIVLRLLLVDKFLLGNFGGTFFLKPIYF
jgi:hypothetical protein